LHKHQVTYHLILHDTTTAAPLNYEH